MLKLILSSLLRHFLSAGGGAIALEGILTSDQVTAAVGALTAIGNIAYSAYKNVKAKAAALPITPSTSQPKYNP